MLPQRTGSEGKGTFFQITVPIVLHLGSPVHFNASDMTLSNPVLQLKHRIRIGGPGTPRTVVSPMTTQGSLVSEIPLVSLTASHHTSVRTVTNAHLIRVWTRSDRRRPWIARRAGTAARKVTGRSIVLKTPGLTVSPAETALSDPPPAPPPSPPVLPVPSRETPAVAELGVSG